MLQIVDSVVYLIDMALEKFKKEVLPLQNKIFRFANRILKKENEAEDLTQDVFLKLWSMKDKLGEYRNVEALAMTMTRKLCFDRIKSKRWNNTSLNETYHQKSTTNDPYKKAELSNSMEHIKNIIDDLPDKQRTVIQLRDVESYEFKEIAEITGMAMDSVRVNLSRARKKIKAELEKKYNYGLKRA